MKVLSLIGVLGLLFFACSQTKEQKLSENIVTYCNPIDINYRFALDEPSRREAADPTVVFYKDKYWLFASKSGGYWYSDDLKDWNFVATNEIPVEDYAPTAIVLNDTLYFMASLQERNSIYKTTDPASGEWDLAVEQIDMPAWDPAFFLDDDGRLYLYWGCSDSNPLYGVEIDYRNNFAFVGHPKEIKYPNPEEFGWEVPGDYNTILKQSPWIEGAWMNKINGKYYLQYSGPGTEFKSYSDGVYVSDQPLGPFEPQLHNPFAYKPEGFANGTGHGSTFTDKYGNFWHIGTVSISQKHMFERRLSLFPTFLDEDGTLYANTKFGDYPMQIPNKKISGFEDIFPGWMLLSFNKPLEVSSFFDSLPATNISDEDIRSYWAATSGKEGEYAIIDLENTCDVYALQINFAEHNTNLFGYNENLFHRFIVECSNDKQNWEVVLDQSQNTNDNVHPYFQLPVKTACRYLKITNVEVPDGNFALSGFRVFGKGMGDAPAKVTRFFAVRNNDNKRSVKLTWNTASGADGYIISYGIAEDKCYHHYTVYNDTLVKINSLNSTIDYTYTISSFNENGVSDSNIYVSLD